MSSLTVRAAALTGYADLASSLGIDPYAQLRVAGIDAACLNNPDLKIPVLRLHVLLESSAQAAGVEDFGLRLAMSRRMSNLGLIALAARDEPTVRAALHCLARTLHLHNDALRIDIEEQNGVVVIREQVLARLAGVPRQSIELAVAVMFSIVREFLGTAWAPKAVCFTHAAPLDLSKYREFFGLVPQFNSVLNGLTCRSADLDRPMPGADAASLRTIRQYVQAEAARHQTQAQRATQLILDLLPTGRCSADLAARYVGVDRRTLHRWLEAEGTSFSALVDSIRQEAAQRLLRNPNLALADLAGMLGFSETSALSRWFSSRFGESPRRWRNAQLPSEFVSSQPGD